MILGSVVISADIKDTLMSMRLLIPTPGTWVFYFEELGLVKR